eukprot:CAMPEP_0194240518 /NCGR_PEP_ID=MMETSP0158-20130606/6667_1 /TAXON_ID=33649 /ORGANISM="Thalassionema nitzschioides, Strain L26-B" /LENGTH=450 /DNA_ID=CAMNT_0038975229 /DNA_START=240 /DNA_END=1592 /DNA_ORIENTATION=-
MAKWMKRITIRGKKLLKKSHISVFVFLMLALMLYIQEYNFLAKTKKTKNISTATTTTPRQQLQQQQQHGVVAVANNMNKKKNRQVPWWDSSSSTVIALAVGYGLHVYQQFVESLRATGFQGHIILGVKANHGLDRYFQKWNVTYKEIAITCHSYCTHYPDVKKCAKDYPQYKLSWGRFPLARDWLLECQTCTSGVLLTDARDAYFQTDPFRYPFGDAPLQYLPAELMLFEEIPEQTTDHWLTAIPIEQCRRMKLDTSPMLCSGSTMGTRQGILNYINVMIQEFDYWNARKECRTTNMEGDDQAIHNYLYYTQAFANNNHYNAASIPHRTGPIHVVGVQADQIFRAAIQKALDQGFGKDLAAAEDFVNQYGYMHWNETTNETKIVPSTIRRRRQKDWRTWLPPEHGLIDPKTGFILNHDGRPSSQVHQFDRFGLMVQMPFVMDLHKNKPNK